MSERANEWTVYPNGEFMPESRALIPYRDRARAALAEEDA